MIPKIKISELGIEHIEELLEEDGIDGGVTLLELEIIVALCKIYGKENSFEIGTFDGRTTVNLANVSDRVYTLDLLSSEEAKLILDLNEKKYIDFNKINRRYQKYPELKNKIVQLTEDSATFDFSQYYNKIGLVFIDGSHSYDYILNDSEIALKLISDNGIIIWHDYVPKDSNEYSCWEGLVKALEKLYSTDFRFSKMKHVENTKLVIMT